ncbi:AbrB/MazE/SpoVT family DNA-binding domain-containing protein [Paenibacillus sp. NPDC055715]
MKNSGMVRNLDGLGRIAIPIEIRNHLGLNNYAKVEFTTTKEAIVMRRLHSESCTLCEQKKHLMHFKDSLICIYCANDLKGNPIPDDQLPSKEVSEAQIINQLLDLMKQYPGATLKTYALMLETSPTYVSHLKK